MRGLYYHASLSCVYGFYLEMMSATPSASAYRADIDGLRAIAVLSVIAFHAFSALAPDGFVGVDIFFVISGYLISSIIFSDLREEKFSFRKFYARRIKRIFPALIALLLGCLVIGWFVMMPNEYMRLGYHIASSSLFIENITLLHEINYFDVGAGLKPLLHLWSLSIEEQFYLLYPLLVWLVWKLRFNLLVFVLLSGFISLAINMAGYDNNPNGAFYLLYARFWELLAGAAIAYPAVQNAGNKKNISPDILSVVGLLLIVTAISGLCSVNHNKLLIAWVVAVSGACFLVAAGKDACINKYFLANRFMVYIGLISYPLYLWHWSLLSFLRLMQEDFNVSTLQKTCAVALSFILAWLSYQWIEKPFRYGKGRIITLAALLLVTCLLGIAVFITKGLPARYPEQVRAIATYEYDQKNYASYGKCWVDRETPPNNFSAQCLGDLAVPSAEYTVLVWGDSHAAHIYPAIDAIFGGNRHVAEFARSTCAPVLGAGDQNCIAGNEYVMTIIKQRAPETVVLFAFWGSYADHWTAESPIGMQLLNTIHTLKSFGVKNIILMGPAPQWMDEVPNLVLEQTVNDAPLYRIPQRMSKHFNPISEVVDADLKELVARERGLEYFSTLGVLCNTEGCLVRTSPEPTSFTSYDYAHFTAYGAQYVAKKLPLISHK